MPSQGPTLASIRPDGLAVGQQYHLTIDDERARAMGISLTDIYAALLMAYGSGDVNDFVDLGRVRRVYVQSKPESCSTTRI
jgi:multidrug efflux pump